MPDARLEVVLFDLDETLYPRSAGLMQAIGERIRLYMEQEMGMPPDVVARLRPEYVAKYGTSLRGLQIHHEVDPEDYLAFVHDIELSDYLGPDQALQAMLRDLKLRKAIFTNATEEHARAVLRVLDVEQCFERIIDVRACGYRSKPHVEAYWKAAELLGVSPERCLMVEDNVRNLRPAKQVGMVTLLVGECEPEEGIVDYHVPDIWQVGEVVRRIVE